MANGKEKKSIYILIIDYFRHFLTGINNARVSRCSYHQKTKLLVMGFNNGVFNLYEMPTFSLLQQIKLYKFLFYKNLVFLNIKLILFLLIIMENGLHLVVKHLDNF